LALDGEATLGQFVGQGFFVDAFEEAGAAEGTVDFDGGIEDALLIWFSCMVPPGL